MPLASLAALATLFLQTLAPAAPALALPIEEHRLANGLRLILAPDPTLGEVSVSVRYDVGSSDDPAGKIGLAHVVEHLMFGGSKHVAPGGHERLLRAAGGTGIGGGTGLDATVYFESVPPEQLPLAVWLESERMAFVADTIDDVATRRAMGEELGEIESGQHLGTIVNVGWGELFPAGHPYHSEAEVLRGQQGGTDLVTAEDARAFARAWYTPGNATIAIAGRFEPGVALALTEKYFATLPSAAAPKHAPSPPVQRIPDVHIDATAAVTRDLLRVSWLAPPLDDADDAALDLASSILSDPEGTLQRALGRTPTGPIAVRERSFWRASVFEASFSAPPGAPLGGALAALERAIDGLGNGVSQDDLERARRDWRERGILRVQSSSARASRLSASRGPATWDPRRYERIEAADISRAVRATLVPTRRVVVVVRSDPRATHAGTVTKREEHAQ